MDTTLEKRRPSMRLEEAPRWDRPSLSIANQGAWNALVSTGAISNKPLELPPMISFFATGIEQGTAPAHLLGVQVVDRSSKTRAQSAYEVERIREVLWQHIRDQIDLKQIKLENAGLRVEIERAKAEIRNLKAALRQPVPPSEEDGPDTTWQSPFPKNKRRIALAITSRKLGKPSSLPLDFDE